MHDDVWEATPGRADGLDRKVAAALQHRDRAAANGSRLLAYLDRQVRDAVAAAERRAVDEAPAGEWARDEWDRRVDEVIAYRDELAAHLGPVPVFGSAEWAAAPAHIKAASHARHEQAVAVERGRQVSQRMAADPVSVASHRAMMAALEQGDTRAAAVTITSLPADVIAQRETDAARRAEAPRPWEAGYAESLGIPQQRAADADCDLAVQIALAVTREAGSGRRRVDDEAGDVDAEYHQHCDVDHCDVDEA